MDCGRFAMRIAWVTLPKKAGIWETPFTLPKPLIHLLCYLVNLVIVTSTRRAGACIDRMSVAEYFPSFAIPSPNNTPVAMIVIEKKKLQIIHLLLLTLVHHLCIPLCFHCLGPVVHPCLHSLLMNCRLAKHIPMVVGSGTLKKESIASPKVTRVGSRGLMTAMTIQQALTRLQQITTIMMSSENCTLHFSSVISLLHPAISTSPTVSSFTRHGSPLVRSFTSS